MSDWIVGSSHAVRWRTQINDGVVSCRLKGDRFIGFGGAPIWSKKNFDTIVQSAGAGNKIGVMVPDFRFGNAICLSKEDYAEDVMLDGFAAVDQQAMTLENDQAMLERGMTGLRQWHQQFGDRAKYFPWCLVGRQILDRLGGRYIGQGVYRHPTFNLDDVIAALPELDIIDPAPLLRQPMHDVVRLFIDQSIHPSRIGYLMLNGLFCENLPVLEAYRRAVEEVEADLVALAERIVATKGPTILTGRSVWLDTLVRYLGATGAQKLAKVGLFVAPLDRAPGQLAIKDVLPDLPPSCSVVVFSAGGADLSSLLARASGTSEALWAGTPCIDWESTTASVIENRRETPVFAHLKPGQPRLPGAILPATNMPMVELGPGGMPTWAGLSEVLRFIASGHVPSSQLAYAASEI